MSEDVNRLEELATLIQNEIPRLIGEATEAINEAINVSLEEAQESESDAPAKLKLAISATWNLDTNDVEVSMPVAVKRKFTRTAKLPDHNQGELPFATAAEDRDGDPMPTDAARAVRNIADGLRKAGVKITAGASLKTGGAA